MIKPCFYVLHTSKLNGRRLHRIVNKFYSTFMQVRSPYSGPSYNWGCHWGYAPFSGSRSNINKNSVTVFS